MFRRLFSLTKQITGNSILIGIIPSSSLGAYGVGDMELQSDGCHERLNKFQDIQFQFSSAS